MMIRGVRVNQDFCKEQSEIGYATMADIQSVLGFDPGKSSQLGPFLLEELKLPILKQSIKTGKPSFDKNVMVQYEEILGSRNDTTAKLILEYRGWQKVVSSLYQSLLQKLSPDGRVRPGFKIHGTSTTRLSCEKPNLQQIPREGNKTWNGKAKEAFIPEEGFILVEYDYSQLEFRLECEYTNEPKLIEAFADPTRDVFTEMSQQLGLCSQLAQERGYIRYWTGRRRHLHPSDSSKAFNSLLQGGAAEVVKRKLLEVDKKLEPYGDDARIVLTVHDSGWVEMRPELRPELDPMIKETMADLPQFNTKFAVDAHLVGGKI
jgi:DNA polymerase I-like protein with 3'-5' exonuclease and polymerase domains